MENDLTFGVVQHEDDNGKAVTSLCCWNDDTDGVLPLDGEPAPAPAIQAQPLTDADPAVQQNMALVVARLEQIAGNFSADYREDAEQALVCARAIERHLSGQTGEVK